MQDRHKKPQAKRAKPPDKLRSVLVMNIGEYSVWFCNPAREKSAKKSRLVAADCLRYLEWSASASGGKCSRGYLRYMRCSFEPSEANLRHMPKENGGRDDDESNVE